jgi:transcription elongation factor GreB
MSRAFVKEQDGNLPEDDIPERPQSPHPNYVTPQGLESLRAQYKALVDKHGEAAAMASEDALLLRAKRELERDIAFLQGRLERAIVVAASEQSEDEVRFGARVHVREEAGTEHVFYVVGEDEADVVTGKVSWISPLAQAMMGAQVGDTVTWHRPAGNAELEITRIEYGKDA